MPDSENPPRRTSARGRPLGRSRSDGPQVTDETFDWGSKQEEDPPPAGVREPRRPKPKGPAPAAAALPEPEKVGSGASWGA